MERGRLEAIWQIASTGMALFANANRDRKKRASPYEPADFNPFGQRRQAPTEQIKVKDLRGIFGLGDTKRGARANDTNHGSPGDGDGAGGAARL